MAEREKPKAPVLPFVAEDEHDWESELANWDAHLPIQDAAKANEAGATAPAAAEPVGAIPIDESSFADTPTTLVSGRAIDDAGDFEAAADEFSERATPHSDVYATIISSVGTGETLFQREPPTESATPIFADPLAEMAAEPWREKLDLLIKLPAHGSAAGPSDDERRSWLPLLAAEMEVADTAAQQAALTLAAARLSETLGDLPAAIALCDDALTLQPGSPAALRARLRLAERQGDAPRALEAIALLAAALDGDERTHYRWVHAEWLLAVTGESDEEGWAGLALSGGDGLARALVEAEVAVRGSDLGRVGAILEPAAQALAGRDGASLAGLAARLSEAHGDSLAAARLRGLAARLAGPGPGRLLVALGQLRDAARAAPAAAESLLGDLLAVFPAGDFKVGCARWAASLARGAGDPERAARLLADRGLGPRSPASLRDLIELEQVPPSVAGGDGERANRLRSLLAEAAEIWQTGAARTCLEVMMAELALEQGDDRRALEMASAGLAAAPGAVPLALIGEQIGRRAVDFDLRLEALRLWARFDPARAAYAQSLVIDALGAAPAGEGTTGADEAPGGEAVEGGDAVARRDDGPVRSALRDLVSAAPMAAAFWTLAARERAAGRRTEAAEALARGAAAWAGSELAPSLEKLARALRDGVPAPWPAPLPGRGKARVAEVPEGVLAEDPANAGALALVTLAQGSDPARLAAIYARAADDAAAAGADGTRFWRLQVVQWLVRAGRSDEARAAAIALYQADKTWEPGRVAAEQLARSLGDAQARARALITLGFAGDDSEDRGDALRAAEARECLGEHQAAAALFRALADGPLAAEGARGLVRLAARAADADADEPVDARRARVRGLLEAARAGRTADVADRLEREPPHQAIATAPALYLAALLREAPGDAAGAADSARLRALAMAWRGARSAADRPGLLCAWRIAEDPARAPEKSSPPPAATGGAGEALAAVADLLAWGEDDDVDEVDIVVDGALSAARARAGDARSSAALLVRAAERDAAAGDAARAEARLRAALERDAVSLPALRGLRRALVARGALAEASSVCGREAEVLKGKDERLRVLLLAAELAKSASRDASRAAERDAELTPTDDIAVDDSGPTPHDASPAREPAIDPLRMTEPLRRILAIEPGHVGAFERLREILAGAGDHAALAEVLAARIAVATNPFEVAALRLARADLLAGPLANAEAAKEELRAILHKEPQHGKALARLADLQYEAGAYAEAAELYLKRALAERSPERLREIFLRIGRIYTRHHHDAKRAADAYKRVLQLEAENREALVALSDLLIETGDSKNAIAVTDRLVDLTPEGEKRVPYLIRLGQLWEQAGDFRQAGARFRRAADDAPRNLAAVGEMVRHFERTRDLVGRRALLDHALLLLRADLHAGKLDLEVLRALVHVMQWRGRNVAAGAGAQLLGALSPDAADRAAAAGAAAPARGRRLVALARPEIGERLFPPDLPSGVRNIFRILGEPLAKAVSDLKRYELARGDRVARGQGPREIIDAIAAELSVKDVDVYVKPARAEAEPAWLAVEPGEPPTLVLGAPILALGPAAIRFAAARGLRLAATHLDLVLRGTPPQTGALVGGVVRQFVTDYRHADVPNDVMNAGAATIGRVLSRRLRQEVMPFAIESAGALDLAALHEAVRDGANQVGLLASGDLPVCLAVVLAVAGRSLSLPHVAANPEALALLDFALSDGYDELCREIEGAAPV